MSNPEEAMIERAIETLHQLMTVLTNLDENLRALTHDVEEAEEAKESEEGAHGTSSTHNADHAPHSRSSSLVEEKHIDSAETEERRSVSKGSVSRGSVRGSSVNRNSVNRGSVRKSKIINEAGSDGATTNAPDEEKTGRQSVSRPSMRKSQMSHKPSEIAVESSKNEESSKRDIAGRLTMFLGQFDKYVNDISGKIETLNDRVEALGYKSGEDGENTE